MKSVLDSYETVLEVLEENAGETKGDAGLATVSDIFVTRGIIRAQEIKDEPKSKACANDVYFKRLPLRGNAGETFLKSPRIRF